MEELCAPQGTFELRRHPPTRDRTLRAWDAADELVLRHVADRDDAPGPCVVVVNDAFGALAVALAGHAPTVVSDSHLAHQAIERNLERNGIDPARVQVTAVEADAPPRIDRLIVKVPKVHALLEDQLRALTPHLHPGTEVVGAGMTRHIHRSTLDVFARTIGPVRTSPAWHKARLIHATVDPGRDPGPWPWPLSFTVLVHRTPDDDHNGDGDAGAGRKLTVRSHPGVFSATALDAGTRLLLEHLPARGAARVVDLGCGNGVVGACALVRNPGAAVTFVDESHRATESARATLEASFPDERERGSARVVLADGLRDLAAVGLEPGSVDLVLTNPPFHRGHTVDDSVARAMFTGARAALRPGGELWVVGNRHLGYHALLRRTVGPTEVVASTPAFVLLRASRP